MSLFGTDGIRGRADQPPLDEHTLCRLGAVLASELVPGQSVLMGHDGRESAGRIEQALARGLASGGISCVNADLVTTPALAHETRLGVFEVGIMISASHNPARDNGIKLFGRGGRKLADDVEAHIETKMAAGVEPTDLQPAVAVPELEGGTARYEDFLHRDAFPDLDLAGVRIALDAANGSGSHLVPSILRSFGAEVVAWHDAPDGQNINANCGALHPEILASESSGTGARLGLCLDGDGDRGIFIDEQGQVLHGDAVLSFLAVELDKRGHLEKDSIVVTVMSNLGLKKALRERGLRVVETPVGDRAVVAAMERDGLTLGGEPSGHIIFGPAHEYTGDGLYAALVLLSILVEEDRPLSELTSLFQEFPQLLINVPCQPDKPDLSQIPSVVAAVQAVEDELGDQGRVVLRYSGTENLCRVMVEGPEESIVKRHTDHIVEAVREAVGV
jgi:phosphoglucosamine mutase